MKQATGMLLVILAWTLSTISAPAVAQDSYPSNTIRLVTGFPSGILDVVARLLAQKLAAQMDTRAIVETKPGFNANIAAEYVAKAKPDGYTLLVNTSSVVFSPAFGEKLGYDVLKDLAPVSLLASSPFVLVVVPAVPANTLAQFIAHVKAHPDKLAYGSTGTGGISHLGSLLFLQANGLSALHVPYKGGAFVFNDLLAGNIQFSMQGQSNSVPLVKANRLKALAITSLKRSHLLPDVPTLTETVMPGFELSTWQAVMAPAKTPPAIVKRLNAEILRALQDPEVKSRVEQEGAELRGTSPDDYGVYLRAELERWTKIIKSNAIKPE